VSPSAVREATAGRGENPIAADVYAGDVATPNPSRGTGAMLFVFRIEADPEPDVFARVAGLFNVANTAPHRASLHRESPSTVTITVAIELAGTHAADMIRRKLEQLTCTLSVELRVDESG